MAAAAHDRVCGAQDEVHLIGAAVGHLDYSHTPHMIERYGRGCLLHESLKTYGRNWIGRTRWCWSRSFSAIRPVTCCLKIMARKTRHEDLDYRGVRDRLAVHHPLGGGDLSRRRDRELRAYRSQGADSGAMPHRESRAGGHQRGDRQRHGHRQPGQHPVDGLHPDRNDHRGPGVHRPECRVHERQVPDSCQGAAERAADPSRRLDWRQRHDPARGRRRPGRDGRGRGGRDPRRAALASGDRGSRRFSKLSPRLRRANQIV